MITWADKLADRASLGPVAGRAKPRAAGHRVVLAAALSATVTTALCLWLACAFQDDFSVYLAGARDLFSGTLYTHAGFEGDLFTYPPFAALMFVPLGLLPGTIPAQVVWALLNEAALLALLAIALKAVRPDLPGRSRRLSALALTAPALLLDPVLLAVRHGQVDIVITLLVVWDLASTRRLGTRTVPLGVATGLAAAIKLTPLIFIPYLILTRRFKAACWCAGTFAAAEAVAFAVAPGVSKAYWTGYVFDYQRIGGSSGLHGLLGLLAPTNQSILAALARFSHAPVPSEPLWALTGAVAGLGVVLAAQVHARWSRFLGIALCAVTGLLISPVTWTHHMIWVLPLAVWLWASPARPWWGRYAATATAVLFWISPIWWVPGQGSAPLHENAWQLIAANSFFLWMCLLFTACAVSLPRRPRTVSRPGPADRRAESRMPETDCPGRSAEEVGRGFRRSAAGARAGRGSARWTRPSATSRPG